MSEFPSPPPPPIGSATHPLSGRLIVLGRLLLLLLAVAAVTVAWSATRPDRQGKKEPRDLYLCPMHPAVRAADPGSCSICRMELEPIHLGSSGSAAASASAPSAQSYDFVRRRGFGSDIRAPAWVESEGVVAAILYNEELAGLAPEELGVYSPAAASEPPVAIQRTPQPPAAWDRSTSQVRFRIQGPRPGGTQPPAKGHSRNLARMAQQRPPQTGAVGWVRLAAKRCEQQLLPNSAVLASAEGPYVLVASADGRTLSKRPVAIGRVFAGSTIILSGLHPRERVLVRDTFFFDAERRLQTDPVVTP